MVRNDANADIITLRYHLSNAVKCLDILSEHLHGIEDSNSDICSRCNHITPNSWEGRKCLCTEHSFGNRQGTWYSHLNFWPARSKKPCWSWKAKDTTWNSPSVKPRAPRNLMMTSVMVHLLLHPCSLSYQDVTTLISSLKPGKGESLILNFGQATYTLRLTKVMNPYFDLEDHASIETSHNG
jgi:hypothetical protein